MRLRTQRHSIQTRAAQRHTSGLFVLFPVLLLSLSADHIPAAAQSRIRYAYIDSILVNAIEFVGDSAFDRETLLQHVTTRETPGGFAVFLYSISERLPFAAEPQYFDYETFQSDLEGLRFYYRSNGFYNAKVEGRYDTVAHSRSVNLFFEIQEGQPSFVDSVAYKNIDQLPEEIRTSILQDPIIKPGQRYRADFVQAEIARVFAILANTGYPLAYIDDIVVEHRASNNNMFVPFPIHPGRQLRFGAIRDSLIGVTELNLSRKILSARLEFQQGDIYSAEKREKSELNLTRLGIFSGVRISPLFPSVRDTVTTQVPITLALAPRKQHDLEPALDANSNLGRLNLGTSLSYLLRNPFGSATTLTTQVKFLAKADLPIENYQATAQVRLDQPYLFRNDISAHLALAYILASEKDNYSGNILQLVPGIEWWLEDRLKLNVDWTLERAQFDEVTKTQALTFFASQDTIDYVNSILSTILELDLTNDIYNPTDGRSMRGTIEEAGILTSVLKEVKPGWLVGYESTQYVKLEGLFRSFRDLSRNSTTILGMKFRGGGIFRYGESKHLDLQIPVYRRYYAGGSNSIRGWHTRTLSAHGEKFAASGGNALIEASVELRWKMFPGARKWLAVEPDNIWMVFFADAGNLWAEPYKIRFSETALAFGVGIRYNLFIGPLRLDYGLKAYNPLAVDHQWFTQKSFWSEVLAKGLIQIGIGHAF